jgi:hypothetical protein
MANQDLTHLEEPLQKQIGQQVKILKEGSYYYVVTPFIFNDGDIFYMALEVVPYGRLVLTDHGHTIMHLTYSMDYDSINQGSRDKIIRRVITQFGLQREEDQLFVETDEEHLADAITNMVQAIARISDVEYLSREQVKDTFLEDFEEFLRNIVPSKRIEFDYINKRHDPQGLYSIDARVNHSDIPLYIFAINTDKKAQDVTITLYEHEKWDIPFRSMAIFRDQTEIGRDVLARLSNVVGQQFSSLLANETRIKNYLSKELELD